MTCRPLPKANLVQAEIYQSGAHQHWHFHKCDLVDDTGELMCWTSASGERKLLFQAMQSAAPAAENVHLVQLELCYVQIKQCFTYETLQWIRAYLGQSNLNPVSICL